MSGILGLVDPAGPDLELLRRAGAAAAYRGSARLVTRGPFALGTFDEEVGPGSLLETHDSVTAADARIDGVLGGASAKPEGPRDVRFWDGLLGSGGPDALMTVAADFAVARLDEAGSRLTLVRDAVGMRPLYWCRRGSRVGFASDPLVLEAMGLTSLDLDEAAVRAYLAFRDFRDERTAFVDVRAIRAGHGITIDGSGRIRTGRWFRPERLIVRELDHEEAVSATREAVTEAVRSRVLGRKVGLLLSSGRDSGSIAVALRDVGVTATCFTQQFDPDLGVNEEVEARRLADECGHAWEPAPVPSAPARSEYLDIPRWAGTPFAYAGFPQETAPIDLAASLGVEVLFNGLGGEPLFSASPAVVFELLRRGRVSEGLEAARTFDQRWTYPLSSIVKASAKTLLPQSVLRARERMRRTPPWVLGPVDLDGVPTTAPRNEQEHLLDALGAGGGTDNDLDERLHRLVGMESAAPLLDLRVIQVAVSLAPGLRAPVPEPKPILAEALLGSSSADRRKVSFQSYYRRLARSAWKTMADVYGPGSRLADAGFIDPDLLRHQRDRWPLESLTVLPVEMWLAHRES